jgi:dual specificity protein kinase YAK1
MIPRRNLTNLTDDTYNNGWDNRDHELIIYVNDVIGPDNKGESYQVIDSLGSGTFGQVMKCKLVSSDTHVALKVIKNSPAYTKQVRLFILFLPY